MKPEDILIPARRIASTPRPRSSLPPRGAQTRSGRAPGPEETPTPGRG